MPTDDEGIVGDELRSKTGGGGLFSDGYLPERPIESYLDADEQPRVVFATDGSGVVRESPNGKTTLEPGSDYRTLVALSTHRVVIVVGGADDGENLCIEIPLTRIDHVAATDGLRESNVRLWVGEDVWTLPVATADPDTVETYLSKASQRRIRFDRLLGEAEDAIVAAADHRSAGRLQSAEQALRRADRSLEEARDPLESFPGDVPGMVERFETYRERYRAETQQLGVRRAKQAYADASGLWRAGGYEAAADAYRRAREVCESVLGRERLSRDSARQVRDVLTSIERDRERLAVAPIRSAAAYRRSAASTSLPGNAAERFRTAYERYRQVLELDWGVERDRFVGDRDVVREQLATIATDLVAARSRAAEQHRKAAIRLTTVQSPVAAMDAYVDARGHLQAAVETAGELDPSAVPPLQRRLEAVERRIDRRVDVGGWTDLRTDRTTSGLPVGIAGQIRPLSADENAGLVPVRTAERRPAVRRPDTDETRLAVVDRPNRREPTLAVPQRDRSRAHHVRRVKSLGEQSLRRTTADVWRDLGWTVERTDGGSPLVARRADVGAALLLSVRRSEIPVEPSAVRALAGRVEARDDEPWPVLVTTDPVEPDAFETALSAGVTIVDTHGLAELCHLLGSHADSADRTPTSASPT